jgi:diguanylate cyclase (GGDEF)-like protein/PAS domain S-box-containing protein
MQCELLEMYAAHAAVAVENARLREAASAALTFLELEKQRFERAFSMAPTGMAMLSIAPTSPGTVLRVNRALCRILGRSEEELVGRTLMAHVLPEDLPDTIAGWKRERESQERRYRYVDGSTRWAAVSATWVEAIGDDPGYRLLHMIDITATKSREERLQYDARHDPLTGLANRRALSEALDDAVLHAGGTALLFCDLDDFKLVNDRYGHEIGDRVLVEVGRRLQAAARAGDVVARMGGDEFVVLGRDLDHVSALRLAHRLSAAVHEPMSSVVAALQISCTVGVAVGGPDADSTDLLARADRHLLDIKRLASSSRQTRGRPSAR